MPRLENWSLNLLPASPYTPPELMTAVMQGNVYGHEHFNDGDQVTTSRLVAFSSKNLTARTRNTLYELGQISPDFEKWLADNGHKLSDYDHAEI